MNTITAARSRGASQPLVSVGITPLKAWAAVGATTLLLQLYAYSRWMTSSLFAPSPVGGTPLSESTHFWLSFWQISLPILTLAILIHAVRTAVRERRVTIDLLMPIVCGSMWWQDGLAGYYRMFIMYNSHMVNMGSWYPFVPGWISPNSQAISEPLLFAGSCYVGVLPLWLLMVAWIIKRLKGSIPNMTMFQMFLACTLITIVFDTVAEYTWVQQGLYSFPHAVQSLSMFPGQPNQYPIYESVLFGIVVGAMASIYVLRDDKGYSLVERGADKLENPTNRTVLRFLALSGAFNVVFFLFYSAPVWFLSFYADATLPNTPSYFLNGMCGQGTQYECPAPDVPMVLPGSGPMPPYTGRN